MTTSTSTAQAEWLEWHREREEALTAPQGWLSLVGYHWIPVEDGEIADFPGIFRLADGGAEFVPNAGAVVLDRVTGEPVGSGSVQDVAESGSTVWLEHHDVALELIRRGDRLAVRVRDPRAAALAAFEGVPTFDYSPEWVVAGEFAAFQEPQPVTVDTAFPGLQQHYRAIGAIRLELDGVPVRLLAYAAGGVADGSAGLNVLFHDSTNGGESALWRSVVVGAPDADGGVLVDFNRTVNLPFAFSDFGTCPRPPAGNVVPAAVTAGERTPAGRLSTAGADDPTAGHSSPE